ncbi:hypothetical protein ACIA74_06710 [Streptomyces sp. NPDC051658]
MGITESAGTRDREREAVPLVSAPGAVVRGDDAPWWCGCPPPGR